MSGMEQLLKSFGFDPQQLKKAAEDFKGLIVAANERLNQIDQRLAAIEKQLNPVFNTVGQGTGPGFDPVGRPNTHFVTGMSTGEPCQNPMNPRSTL